MFRPQNIRRYLGGRYTNNENGVILIVALTLLTALILAGATAFIVASTEVKVGGNFRTNQTALQVAMAGSEQARETLRAANASSANPANFSEELAAYISSPLASSSTLMSGYAFNASLTNDSAAGESSTTDNNGKVVITSVATGPNNSNAIVTTTVQLYNFAASSPAVVYSKDNVTLNGSAISVNGNDAGNCGGTSLAPVYTKDPATTNENGSPVLSGSPPTPAHGPTDIDLQAVVDQLKGAANYTLTNDVSEETYGSASNYVTVYADAVGTQADHELRLNNVTGYGTLIVKGDLQLAGNINWKGIIVVTGTLTSSGGGSNAKNIQGQIFAGSSSLGDTAISGNIDLGYNSCEVKKAMSGQPLKMVSWKQNY